jgi:CBS domain-containing protein
MGVGLPSDDRGAGADRHENVNQLPMSVGRICSRDVDTANYDEPVLDSAHRMRDRQVGTVIVVDDMRPVGILTDRDLTLRVLAAGLDPQATRVSEVMTPSPTTIGEDDSIETAVGYMRAGRFRRLPVVGRDGRLIGILALDDVLELVADELVDIGQLLKREAPHRWLGRQT